MPEEEEKEHEIGNLFEKIMKENFPKLVKEIDIQVQEAERVPNKRDANKLSKEQRQNHGYKESFDGCQMGGSYGGMGKEVSELRSTN